MVNKREDKSRSGSRWFAALAATKEGVLDWFLYGLRMRSVNLVQVAKFTSFQSRVIPLRGMTVCMVIKGPSYSLLKHLDLHSSNDLLVSWK